MSDSTSGVWTTLAEFVPRLFGAVVVLLLALVAALFLQRLMARFLEEIGLDDLFQRTGAANSLWQFGYEGGPRACSASCSSGGSCSPASPEP